MRKMKDFSATLIEENEGHLLSVDFRGKKEYTYKNRCGTLERSFDSHWKNKSQECHSLAVAANTMRKSRGLRSRRESSSATSFQVGAVVRENSLVLEYLQKQNIPFWKVIFRANSQRRIIIDSQGQEFNNHFRHFSLLVQLQLNGRMIEIGEGNTTANKYNQDGLIARIDSLLNNHREAGRTTISGKIPVILNQGSGAILFHEILGHSLEADHIAQKESPLSLDDLNQKIAWPAVTLVSGHKSDTYFSSIGCDDEGGIDPPEILVEKGILRDIISDTFHSRLLGLPRAGHARTADFTFTPLPRMYGIYLKPGKYSPKECVESTEYGVYAREFGEGKVFFNKDLFFFHINEAVLVEKGKLSKPLGSVIVRGSIREALNSVTMAADDFSFDRGISYCFKKGQVLNVRVGQPTVKIENLQVCQERHD